MGQRNPQNTQNPKIGTRKLISGEVLLKPGDRIQFVYVIQSGCISVCNAKGTRFVEITRCFTPASLGDEAIFGPVQWNTTAIAVRPTVVLEIPVEMMKMQLQASNPILPVMMKALSDRAKAVFADLRAQKSNRDVVACPPDETAKLFGVIFHTARILANLKKGETQSPPIDWEEFKRFAWEMFDEPSARLEDGVTILVKHGYAKVEGTQIMLLEMNQIESFFDYYGNYYFKGGNDELLKTNSKATKVTEAFLTIAAKYPVDRGNYAHLPYTETVDRMKELLGKTFEADQLFRLEQKGLFIKRTATQDGGKLSFYKPDFEQMLLNWKILREIEVWNETGYIEPAPGTSMAGASGADPVDHVEERRKWAKLLSEWKPAVTAKGVPELRKGGKKPGEIWCAICMSPMKKGQKLCEICGAQSSEAA
jgi:CRP-like cAMP-binding protein